MRFLFASKTLTVARFILPCTHYRCARHALAGSAGVATAVSGAQPGSPIEFHPYDTSSKTLSSKAEPQRGRVLPPRHAPAGLPRSYNPVGCMVLQVLAGSSCWARRAAAGASRTGGTSAFTAR